MGWFNYYGLIVMAIIMIPNIIFAVKHKERGAETSQNKVLTVLEQIGRYGCLLFMVFQITYTFLDFWFPNALIVYLSVNGVLCFFYLLFWVICQNQNGMLKAIPLSVIPSIIFLFSGIVCGNILLILSAVLFAGSHIPISIQMAKNSDCTHK